MVPSLGCSQSSIKKPSVTLGLSSFVSVQNESPLPLCQTNSRRWRLVLLWRGSTARQPWFVSLPLGQTALGQKGIKNHSTIHKAREYIMRSIFNCKIFRLCHLVLTVSGTRWRRIQASTAFLQLLDTLSSHWHQPKAAIAI